MIKRTITLLLFSILLFSVACSKGTGEAPDKEDILPDQETQEPSQDEKVDLEEYKCVVFYCPDGSFAEDSIFWYNPGTIYYELAMKRLDDIQSEFNCSIETNYFASTSAMTNVLSAEAAMGNHSADLIAMSEYETISGIITAGLLIPIDDTGSIIDYHNADIFGTANIMEPALYNGMQYMVTPYTHPERQLLVDSFLVFGESIANEYNIPDLRSVHEQKQWTWDYFEGFLNDYTVIEDNKTLVYGLSATNYLPALALSSNGYELAVLNDDGTWRNGCLEPNVLETIDWIKKIKTEYKSCIRYNTSWDDNIEDVVNGRAFICASENDDLISDVQYKLDGFGILPFPYGPSCEYGKQSIDSTIYGYGIAVTSDEPQNAAVILNAYCQPFAEYPTVDDALKTYEQFFFDNRDINTLKQMTDYSRYLYWGGSGISYLNSAINQKYNSSSSAEIVANIADTMTEVIEKFIIPNMDYVNEYFAK